MALDDGRSCGRCDICAPRDCRALRFRAPSAGEHRALGRMLDALRRTNGQAGGRLHRELFGEAILARVRGSDPPSRRQ